MDQDFKKDEEFYVPYPTDFLRVHVEIRKEKKMPIPQILCIVDFVQDVSFQDRRPPPSSELLISVDFILRNGQTA